MIIINADDLGRSIAETDAALSCYRSGRITSVSAMVFMEDSRRAAELAKDAGVDIGLHLNLSQRFSGECRDVLLREYHDQIVSFLMPGKYSVLFYNPALRKQFRYVYQAQVEEFRKLFGKPPSHIDGHHHKHLCANMLVDNIIPYGEKVRRNFTFRRGEKGFLSRTFRRLVDQRLARRYRLTDLFIAFSQSIPADCLARVAELPNGATMEIMVHPINADEYASLMSDDYLAMLRKQITGTYSSL